MKSLACWLALSLAVGGSAMAQQHPDLSGYWKLLHADPQASTNPDSLGVTLVPDGPFHSLKIVRQFKDHARTDTFRIGIKSGTVGGTGSSGEVSASWNHETLRISIENYVTQEAQQLLVSGHEEEWSLDKDGRLLIKMIDREAGTEPRVVNLAYERDASTI